MRPTSEDDLALGQLNYEAYRKQQGILSGRSMPSWESLDVRSQRCWVAGAKAVIRAASP
jgi:hypothetical protein